MLATAMMPPARRADLVLRPQGGGGQHIVKDPRSGAFFQIGEQEAFLLQQLDGTQTTRSICAAFEERFGQPLTEADLREFVDLVGARGFLQPPGRPEVVTPGPGGTGKNPSGHRDRREPAHGASAPPRARPRINPLAWRIPLFDPDRWLGRLEPALRFVWTKPFLVVSAGGILVAAALVWLERRGFVSQFPHALRWETLALAWLTLLVVTACHEFAHGLTCKHYGGEVHEIGFLMLFFMPCLYCNVSDAWLFDKKSRRLWVTLAGGYCDLVVWALAAFVWRVTLRDSGLNYLAWVVVSVCGVRFLFNFNPLLKLDGYYLLSDLVNIPNLRPRALAILMAHLRRLLWGGPRPQTEPRGALLVGYGAAACLFSLGFLALMVVNLVRLPGPDWRWAGLIVAALLGVITLRDLFSGFFAGEFSNMIRMRRPRAAVWILTLGALPAVLALGQMEDWARGPFRVRAVAGAELRAPVAGFLRAVYLVEGERASPGALIARLEVPDLASRIAQKKTEVHEAQANLRLLVEGTRSEEIVAQRRRVDRARQWRDLARGDLERSQRALREELARLDAQINRSRTEHAQAVEASNRARQLFHQRALSAHDFREADTRWRVLLAEVKQAEAQRRAREAEGTREAETELSRREQALAEAEASLALLEAGTRPAEIEAARARLARFEEEANYLEGLREKLLIYSPVRGVITTPHLREKIGQYFREGELICEVKAATVLEVEIALDEQRVARVRPGQRVELKARALPFHTSRTRVDRIAPSARSDEGQEQGKVTVYCRLEDPQVELRPGMTGYACIACGRRPIGEVLAERIQGVLRTEFWW